MAISSERRHWQYAMVNPYWLVVFCDPMKEADHDAPKFWRNRVLRWVLERGLRSGFRHCFAMRPMNSEEGWIVMNPHSACHDVLELPWEAGLNFVLEEVHNGTARVVCVRARRPSIWMPRIVMTCVTNVAHLIGVTSWPWTTPYSLYCQLKKEEPDMGSVFSAPKADTSAADAQIADAKREANALKKKNEAKLNAMRSGNTGRSLLAFSKTGEVGVKTKLGAS